MSAQTVLVEAVKMARIVDILYKGSWRTVEPHLIGVNQKGNVCLSAFQISGGSGFSWRAFLLKEIGQVALRDEVFEIRDGYNPNDSTMLSIIASL